MSDLARAGAQAQTEEQQQEADEAAAALRAEREARRAEEAASQRERWRLMQVPRSLSIYWPSLESVSGAGQNSQPWVTLRGLQHA